MSVPSAVTVSGPVPVRDLSRVLMHEHLSSLLPGAYLSGGQGDDAFDLGVRATSSLRSQGVCGVVSLSGHYMPASAWDVVARIAEATGLHVIAGFGYYTERRWPKEVRTWSLDQLIETFVTAAETIPGANVPAGIYGEIGTSLDLITDGEERQLKAVAQAHRITGVPIYTHCSLGTMVAEQVDILAEAGADLEQVMLGHVDLRPDADGLEPLLRRGVTLAFDTFGKQNFDYVLREEENYEPGNELKRLYTRRDDDRADALAELVRRGWARQLVISLDMTGRETYLNVDTHGAFGYSYFADCVLPMLRQRGVTDGQVEVITRENPARLLTVRT